MVKIDAGKRNRTSDPRITNYPHILMESTVYAIAFCENVPILEPEFNNLVHLFVKTESTTLRALDAKKEGASEGRSSIEAANTDTTG